MVAMMIKRFKNQIPVPTAQDSGSTLIVPSQEAHITKNQHKSAPSIQINMPQSVPQLDHHEIPHYEEETSAGIDKKKLATRPMS